MTVTASYDDSAGAGHMHDRTAPQAEIENIAVRSTDTATAQDHARSLLARTLPSLERFGRGLTGSASDVGDPVQRTLRKPGLLSSVTGLGGWMRGIMRNDRADGGKEAAPHLSQVGAARKAMETLAPDLREALTLVTIEGLSYRQAADRLGIPVARLNAQVARARASLAEQLGLLPAASDCGKR